MPPKSILKKTSSSSKHPVAPPAADRDPTHERNLKLALHHANLIQQQKDFETAILDATLTLLDYPPELPSSPPADPAHPSPAAARTFTTLVSIFQPHDYDNLLTERQVAGKCAYALCPRAPVTNRDNKGKFRFLDDHKGGLKVVPKQQIELWCSKECAKRALYVKVQLLEEPGWLRRGNSAAKIDLLPEPDAPAAHTHSEPGAMEFSLPYRPKKEAQEEGISNAMQDLALERGDEQTSFNATHLISDTVREKRALKVPEAPSFGEDADRKRHATIEGYNPKDPRRKGKLPMAADADEDMDWNI